jgi:DNA polymerase-3 subunit delta'
VTDVFSSLLGQDRAVAALREYVRHPVHAYLLHGPAGSSVHDAALCLAAALECPDRGCGTCDVCRRVLAGTEPDVHVAERSGVNWRVDDLREVDRISRRRPLGGGYQIIILEDIDKTVGGATPSAPALLKSLEEPPAKTIYILTAEELPEELVTIESRCVSVPFVGLATRDIEALLVSDGASAEAAATAARAAQGNLRRARILVADEALGQRLALWRGVPDALHGTAASAAEVATAIAAALDEGQAPLVALQERELADLVAQAKEAGQRSVANRKDIETQFKREQRRFRNEELRFGLSALTGVYRDRLGEALAELERSEDATARHRVAVTLEALDILVEANARLATNLDETLLLHDLFLSLMRL